MAKSAWSASVGCHSMAWSGGVPWPGAVGLGVVGGRGRGRQLRRRSAVAGRTGARAPGAAAGVASWARSRTRTARGRRGCSRRGHRLRGVERTEPQHGGLPDQRDQLVLLDVRHADDELVVAGGGDLALADPQRVDPGLDDALGQLQAVRIDLSGAGGVLGGQRDGGAALQVKTQLRGPVVGQRHQAEQRGHDHAEARSRCGRDGRFVLPTERHSLLEVGPFDVEARVARRRVLLTGRVVTAGSFRMGPSAGRSPAWPGGSARLSGASGVPSAVDRSPARRPRPRARCTHHRE